MRRRATLALLAAGAFATAEAARKKTKPAPAVRHAANTYGVRDDLRAFAVDVAARRSLDAAWIVKHLAQAQKLEAVQRLMMPAPAGSAKNWNAYRDRFVEPRRIAAGATFWQNSERWLAEAHERWGVPPHIVVGIVGVETFYGRITGGFRVVDALATLAFDFPTGRKDRSPFFRDELEEFLVYCDREGADPQALKGSFAGAMGWPQFMPGSINRYALDFDGDGHVDLNNSLADIVGSVAHYLAQHGWRRDEPTHFRVTPPDDAAERARLLEPDILPTFSALQFGEHGALLEPAGLAYDDRLALVELQNGEQGTPTYIAGTPNFYAVTRYNWSSYYAMAVIALGEAVQRAR